MFSAFTFVRNALKFDYPVVESIRSVLPLCDEFVVAVGDSEDGTRELIASIGDPRIRTVDTIWDDSLRSGGKVLAIETNKAFDAISPLADWAFYIQADEVLHEKFRDTVRQAVARYTPDRKVEGLLFNYLHFYGSYDYIGDSRRWYRREVRIIRNDKSIRSYRDAQGFRKNGQKLFVRPSGGEIYHYGWVKPPEKQQAKQEIFNRYWHDDTWIDTRIPKTARFDYSGIDSLAPFCGSHPEVMKQRIRERNWKFDYDPSGISLSFKDKMLKKIEVHTGWRPGEYKNYRLLT